MVRRILPLLYVAATAIQPAAAADAQNYPEKPIRVHTTAPGGASDLATRIMTQAMTGSFGQRMVVENRGIVSIEIVAAAPPDGYNLLAYSNVVWLMPLMRSDVSWNLFRDFAPIVLTQTTPNLLVVHPSLPLKTVRELTALAKARPGQLNYASSSIGSGNHVAAELFKAMAGVNIVRINYKGVGVALNDVLSGQVQVMFPSAGSVTQYVKIGKLRALAVTSIKPSALAPGMPTVADSGLPGYESVSLTGMFAPAKTPEALIKRLNHEIGLVLSRPELKERFLSAGMEVAVGTPEEFAATIKSEVARVGKIVNEAGLRE